MSGVAKLNRLVSPFLLAIILLSLQPAILGQSSHGWIAGRVQDTRNSLVLEGVVISVTGPDGAKIIETSTDSSGHYQLLWLPPGDYELKIGRAGYYTYTKRVRVESERGSLVNVSM
jgi:hypothetical protein